MEKTGKVWLVGAGPGDAGLLTLKGKWILEQADVVFYDALIQMELLCQIPCQAEKINVGKRAGNHPVPQEEINQMILDEAMAGKRVVRLKGGDPFVFGRGGEELELLADHGIPFEIVPGITSAVAVPAYAGIPVTHRQEASSFHVITGHAKKGETSRIDYEALVRAGGTLIFLMGISAMEEIAENLMKAGMAPETPAAVLEKGTTARQRRLISTVEHLVEDAKKKEMGTPAIIVVGSVCRLGETLEWESALALGGKQILVTRPAQKASEMAARLRRIGAHVIELPSIEPVIRKQNKEFLKAAQEISENCPEPFLKEKQRVSEYWIVLTSPSGADIFFESLKDWEFDLRHLFKSPVPVKFAAIGSSTAGALKRHGIYADLVPGQFYGKNLGEELAETAAAGSLIYLFRASEVDRDLTDALDRAEKKWKEVPIYDTVIRMDDTWKGQVKWMLENGEIDYVTFTSASTVAGFTKAMGELDYSLVPALCIGGKTAAAAAKYGMKIMVSEKPSMDSMIEKMISNNF